MTLRTREWLVLIAMSAFWVLNIYQGVQPTNELRLRGAWGGFLIGLPVLTFLLAISVIPFVALHLKKEGGWRGRSPVFYAAQVVCWAFPIVYVGGMLMIFVAVLLGARV